MSQEANDTSRTNSPRFTPESEEKAQRPETNQPAISSARTQATREMAILDGHEPVRNFMPTNDFSGTESRREEVRPQQEPVKEQAAPQKPAKIFGKYESLEAAEKAYKELEKQFHSSRSEKARALRDLEAQAAQLREERDYYRGRTKNEDEFDEIRVNQELSENPAQALKNELERRDRVARKQAEQQARESEMQKMRESIAENISTMESEYSEFKDNRAQFAEWMTYYHMDTGRIMADRTKAQEAYRDFLDANKELSLQPETNAGVLQAVADKEAQVPPSSGQTGRSPRATNPRFTPTDNRPMNDNVPAKETDISIDPLDEMERTMGLGSRPGMF